MDPKPIPILVFRDRPRLAFSVLRQSGIQTHWAANLREARDCFQKLPDLRAIIVDAQENVEKGMEFCEIVHVNRPRLPILFVRSVNRPLLEPRCANRILDPEVTEEDLADEILLLINEIAPPNTRSA